MWLDFIDEKKRSMGMLKRAVHPCNKAWSQWQEWWEERREVVKAMKQVARRALNQPLIRALNAWLELVEEMKALQRYTRTVAHPHTSPAHARTPRHLPPLTRRHAPSRTLLPAHPPLAPPSGLRGER